MNNELQIPFRVVKNGMTDKYIELKNEENFIKTKIDDLINVINEIRMNIFKLISKKNNSMIASYGCDLIANFYFWQEEEIENSLWISSLKIEELSKEMTNKIGNLQELRYQLCDLRKNIDVITKGETFK